MDLIKALNEKQLQAEKPQVNVGDTVKRTCQGQGRLP